MQKNDTEKTLVVRSAIVADTDNGFYLWECTEKKCDFQELATSAEVNNLHAQIGVHLNKVHKLDIDFDEDGKIVVIQHEKVTEEEKEVHKSGGKCRYCGAPGINRKKIVAHEKICEKRPENAAKIDEYRHSEPEVEIPDPLPMPTPVQPPAQEKPEWVCFCGKKYKTFKGYTSHQQDKHSGGIEKLFEEMNKLAEKAAETVASALEQSEGDKEYFSKVQEMSSQIDGFAEAIQRLQEIPVPYRDDTLIAQMQALQSKTVSDFIPFTVDPRYRRATYGERMRKLNDLMVKASQMNSGGSMQSENFQTWKAMLNGDVLIPSERYGKEPVMARIWSQVNSSLNKAGFKPWERIENVWQYIGDVVDEVVYNYVQVDGETPPLGKTTKWRVNEDSMTIESYQVDEEVAEWLTPDIILEDVMTVYKRMDSAAAGIKGRPTLPEILSGANVKNDKDAPVLKPKFNEAWRKSQVHKPENTERTALGQALIDADVKRLVTEGRDDPTAEQIE